MCTSLGTVILQSTAGTGEKGRHASGVICNPRCMGQRWVKVEAGGSLRRLLDWCRQDVLVAWMVLVAMRLVRGARD